MENNFVVSVAITSIILSVIASYFRTILDKGISKLSSSYKEKISLLKEEENKFNIILLESEEFRNIHRDEAIFERIRSTWFLILSIFVFILVAIIQFNNISILIELSHYTVFLGFISLLLSIKYVISSTKKWNRAFEASNANKAS